MLKKVTQSYCSKKLYNTPIFLFLNEDRIPNVFSFLAFIL